jgi:c-di-GMP-binding flagellar brake protein YcgR
MAPADERRRFPRLKVPVYYRSARLFGPRKPAHDVSLGGIRIFTDDALTVGKRLEIELFLPDGGSLTIDVRVAWVRSLTHDDFAQYEAGLEFLAMDPEQEKLLERCVMDVRSDLP